MEELKCALTSGRNRLEVATNCTIQSSDILEKAKTKEAVKRSVAARVAGRGGMNWQSTDNFQGSEATL